MVPKLEILDHDGNKIGDAGCAALAEAVGSGALPELKMLYLDNNETWRRRHGSAETRGIGVDIDTLLWTARPEMPGTHRVGVFVVCLEFGVGIAWWCGVCGFFFALGLYWGAKFATTFPRLDA